MASRSKETGEVIKNHPAKVEGGGVLSMTEDYDRYGPSLSEDPRPAMLGMHGFKNVYLQVFHVCLKIHRLVRFRVINFILKIG